MLVGARPSMLEVLSSIPIYDFRSLFDFRSFRVGTEVPVKLNGALVERERERCGRGDKMSVAASKLSYLGERSEPRNNAPASGGRASTFHDISQMESLLAGATSASGFLFR